MDIVFSIFGQHWVRRVILAIINWRECRNEGNEVQRCQVTRMSLKMREDRGSSSRNNTGSPYQ